MLAIKDFVFQSQNFVPTEHREVTLMEFKASVADEILSSKSGRGSEKMLSLQLSIEFTHSGARACLEVCLIHLTRNANQSSTSQTIRYFQALGLLIAKLSTRLKYSKDYKDLDTKAELEVAKKLKKL